MVASIVFSVLMVPTVAASVRLGAAPSSRPSLATTSSDVFKTLGSSNIPSLTLLLTSSLVATSSDIFKALPSLRPLGANLYQGEIPATYMDSKTVGLQPNDTINEIPSASSLAQDTGVIKDTVPICSRSDLNGTEAIHGETGLIVYGQAAGASVYSGSPYTQIDSVGIQSYDPNRPYAEPLDLAKDGHWFPNKDYSRICYEVYPFSTSMQFYINISPVEDVWDRYFRVYYDGSKVFETAMYGFNGYVYIPTSAGGYHKLTLEIQWGYYSDHGWKLVSFKPTSNAMVTGEFFPNEWYSRLRWNAQLGPDSRVSLQVDAAGDPYSRYLRIYVDGVQKYQDYAPSSYTTVYVGEYVKQSLHEVTVEVQWGNYMDWGWKLRLYRSAFLSVIPPGQPFSIDYAAVHYEIDYMPGHGPLSDVLNYIQNYYLWLGYERPVFVVDQLVPYLYAMYEYVSDFDSHYYNVYFQHKGQAGWKYMLFGNYAFDGGQFGILGWADQLGGNRTFIADQECHDIGDNFWYQLFYQVSYFKVSALTVAHEVGHSISIGDSDGSGNEVYCSNSFCVMAVANWDNLGVFPLYCQHHWNERVFP